MKLRVFLTVISMFVMSRNASTGSLVSDLSIVSVFPRVNIVELCRRLKFFGGQGHFKLNIRSKERIARINGILYRVDGACVCIMEVNKNKDNKSI